MLYISFCLTLLTTALISLWIIHIWQHLLDKADPPFTIGVQSINDVPFGRGFKPESDQNYGPAYVISPKWWEGGCGPIQSAKSDIIYEQPSLFIHFWLNPLKSEITKWMIPELQTSFDREGLKHFEMCCTVVWLFSAMFQFGNFPLLRLCYCC